MLLVIVVDQVYYFVYVSFRPAHWIVTDASTKVVEDSEHKTRISLPEFMYIKVRKMSMTWE